MVVFWISPPLGSWVGSFCPKLTGETNDDAELTNKRKHELIKVNDFMS